MNIENLSKAFDIETFKKASAEVSEKFEAITGVRIDSSYTKSLYEELNRLDIREIKTIEDIKKSITKYFLNLFNKNEKIKVEQFKSLEKIAKNAISNISKRTKISIDYSLSSDIAQESFIKIFNIEINNIEELIKFWRETRQHIYYLVYKELNPDEVSLELFISTNTAFLETSKVQDEMNDRTEAPHDSVYEEVRASIEITQEENNEKFYLDNIKKLLKISHKIYELLKDDFLKNYFIARFIQGFSKEELVSMIIKQKGKGRPLDDGSKNIGNKSFENIEQEFINTLSTMLDTSGEKVFNLLCNLNIVFSKLFIERLKNIGGHDDYLETVKKNNNYFKQFSFERILSIFNQIIFEIKSFVDFDFIKKSIDNNLLSNKKNVPMNLSLPNCLSPLESRGIALNAIAKARFNLKTFWESPEKFCIKEVQPLYPHQYEKLKKMLNALEKNVLLGNPFLAIADIAPPSAGKTYMQAVLAKILELPFLFVTPTSSIIYGSDGAFQTFQKLFSLDEIGIVDQENKDFFHKNKITTFKTFTNPCFLKKTFSPTNKNYPSVIFLDEGDLAQTEIRIDVLNEIKKFLGSPITCIYSATKKVAGKDLENFSLISDEMSLSELIFLRKAKSIVGFYAVIDIEISNGNFIGEEGEKEVSFKKLKKAERESFVDYPVDIYTKKHKGESFLIFCISIKHAQEVVRKLKEEGVTAECVSGRPLKEQLLLKEKYIKGEIQVLTSCDYIGRGFSDYGRTQGEIFARITQSETLLYQYILRGIRPNINNPLLFIYQLIPPNLNLRKYKIATLENVLDIKSHSNLKNRLNGLSIEEVKKVLEGIPLEEKYKFLGLIGAEVSDDDIKFTSSMAIKKATSLGDCSDVRIEKEQILNLLKEKGINNRYDIIYFGVTKFVKETFPPIGGSTSFVQYVLKKEVSYITEDILKELAEALFGNEKISEFKDFLIKTLATHDIKNRYELKYYNVKEFTDINFYPIGSGRILIRKVLGEKVKKVTSENLKNFSEYLFGEEIENEFREYCIGVLKQKNIYTHNDLVNYKYRDWQKEKFGVFGGMLSFAIIILKKEIDYVTKKDLEVMGNFLFS